jgi:hypothetical protein
MATLGNLAIGILKLTGTGNIAAGCRCHCRDATRTPATPRPHTVMTETDITPLSRDPGVNLRSGW